MLDASSDCSLRRDLTKGQRHWGARNDLVCFSVGSYSTRAYVQCVLLAMLAAECDKTAVLQCFGLSQYCDTCEVAPAVLTQVSETDVWSPQKLL